MITANDRHVSLLLHACCELLHKGSPNAAETRRPHIRQKSTVMFSRRWQFSRISTPRILRPILLDGFPSALLNVDILLVGRFGPSDRKHEDFSIGSLRMRSGILMLVFFAVGLFTLRVACIKSCRLYNIMP